MIKVLFSDLDGTLLSSFGQRNGVSISEENKKAVKKLVESGCKFCIASGRNTVYTDQVLEALDLKDGDVIACNGGTVSMEGKKAIHTVKTSTMIDFLNFYYEHLNLEAYRVFGVEADNTYVADVCDDFFINRYGNSSYIITTDRDIRDYVKNPEKYVGFQKIMIAILDGNNEKWQKFFIPRCEENFDIGCPIPKQIEMMEKGVNKGTAIDDYIAYYGFKPEEIAAVGDANNDIPMLKKAKYSYVMRSGEDEAKQMAYKTVDDVASCICDILELNQKSNQ